MPKVSIIMPTYNYAKYIRQAIDSIMAQTYKDFEILVIDDGSTDNTAEVIEKYVKSTVHSPQSTVIRYIHQSNKGHSAALNTGLRNAKGNYITFLDSDDLFMPDKLELQVKAMESSKPQVGLIYSWWSYIDSAGNVLPEKASPRVEGDVLKILLFDCFFPMHSTLIRRECFDKAGLFDETLARAKDWDMWLRFASQGVNFSYVPKVLAKYRVHNESLRVDINRMSESKRRIIDKFYTNKYVSKELGELKNRVYSNIYFQSAIEYYKQGQKEDAARNLETAYDLSPQLFKETETFNKIAYSINSPFGYRTRKTIYDNIEKIEALILDFLNTLVKRSINFNKDKKEIYANAYMQLAMLNYYGRHLKKARNLFLKSFYAQPSQILKGKNLFTFLKSLLPLSFFRKELAQRILYFLDIFPAVSETFILNEILELEKRGIDIVIFARRKEESFTHGMLKGLKAPIRYLPNAHALKNTDLLFPHVKTFFLYPLHYLKTLLFALKRRQAGTLWFFKISCFYADIVRKYKPSHIHAHFASTAGEYGALVSTILNIPYTFTAHGWHDIFEYPPVDFKDRAERAKKVVTISCYNKRYMSDRYAIPQDKIEVIRCGIDANLFNGHDKKHGGEVVILSVGRLHQIKGTEYLIKACKLLKKQNLRFKCVLIGDGKERSKLERLISSLDLSDIVHLEGARPIEEVRKRYSSADIYVQPSICEGMPISVMEAMASKLPVVATNITGLPELVEDGITGYLVEPKNEEAIAAAIGKLINDHDKRETMGELGRKKVEREFNLKTEVGKLEKVWFDGKN